MNKILVTGGAGFIGSHLCESLLNDGNKVICLDNMFTGSYDNISPFFSNPNFEFINANVIDPIWLDVDMIYNLACPASPIHYQYDPVMTTKTSFFGALNVLNMARKNHARVLQASTSEIYGNPIMHPQSEEYLGNVNTMGPRACYDEGKRIAETLFYDYNRLYGVDIRIIRIFNTYGPRMCENDGRVVSNFIIRALRGSNIQIYGDGSQTRSFCFISDLVSGMKKLMDSDYTKPVNIGNPFEMTIKELAELIIRKTNSTSKIIYTELPVDDPIRRKPSIKLAKKLLDWQPYVNIEDGIQMTIDYYKSKY